MRTSTGCDWVCGHGLNSGASGRSLWGLSRETRGFLGGGGTGAREVGSYYGGGRNRAVASYQDKTTLVPDVILFVALYRYRRIRAPESTLMPPLPILALMNY